MKTQENSLLSIEKCPVLLQHCVHSCTGYNLIFVRKWCLGPGKERQFASQNSCFNRRLETRLLDIEQVQKSGFPAILNEDHA